MSVIGEIIGIGSIVGIVLMVIAKLLPNDKLRVYGITIGKTVDIFGRARLGQSWEKLEDFLVNSIGVFLEGFKEGLDYPKGKDLPDIPETEKKDNVRK